MKQQNRSEPASSAAPASHCADRAGKLLAKLLSESLAPGLHLVSTPIGNLGDMSLRALSVLVRADHVFCEDTRVSLKLLTHFGVSRRLDVYHDHNADRVRPRILELLASGQSVALISDAGTPLISDPGCKLVREARRQGAFVTTIPGPTAAVAALAASGLPTDSFFFAGFLPAKAAARQKRLEALADVPGVLIFYETANRLAESLAALKAVYPNRDVAAARELTKLHEEYLFADDLDALSPETPPKGEIVLLVGPPVEEKVSDEQIITHLQRHMKTVSLREAVDFVARDLKMARKRVYGEALKLKEKEEGNGESDDWSHAG